MCSLDPVQAIKKMKKHIVPSNHNVLLSMRDTIQILRQR